MMSVLLLVVSQLQFAGLIPEGATRRIERVEPLALLVQDPKPHPGVDQKRVDEAIKKGAEWLLAQEYKPYQWFKVEVRSHEIVLYTLLHAGVDRENAKFKALLDEVLKSDITKTYMASFQAMLLQALDPEKYQWRIAQCCQFLVDNQCKNGQWSYGEPTELGHLSQGGGRSSGTKALRRVEIRPQREGPGAGDNSNSQIAALALRACMEASVFPPQETLARALVWWERTQNRDGGWGYTADKDSYGSMTAGGLGSVVLYREYLKKEWKRATSYQRAERWLKANFSAKQNELTNYNGWFLYFLYGVERAGMLTGKDELGGHDWYKEGANAILDLQQKTGAWQSRVDMTCFAILFLRRATMPLPSVATERNPKRDR